MRYVLDTHTLFWWTLDPKKLSPIVKDILSDLKGDFHISSISLWELGIKQKNKKLSMGISIREYTERLRTLDRIKIQAVDEETWIQNLELDWDHRDPADRNIVATAQILEAAIITKDEKIRSFYEKTIW